jgi:hypothetical protein
VIPAEKVPSFLKMFVLVSRDSVLLVNWKVGSWVNARRWVKARRFSDCRSSDFPAARSDSTNRTFYRELIFITQGHLPVKRGLQALPFTAVTARNKMFAGGPTMASLPNSGSQSEGFSHRDIKWSPGEKAVARKAFEQALQQEFETVMNEARQRAAKIKEPSDMWDLEDYLTQSRKNIDRDFDYRYSRLMDVFAILIQRGRLTLEELDGLSEEKLDQIRSTLNYL